ncbi:MAG: Crp/Fnr family transcriptional regulator [Acidobacteria bacterium]|nr:Crp/Fnr family transcriptional regulator [Acidobacteriota bacterium]
MHTVVIPQSRDSHECFSGATAMLYPKGTVLLRQGDTSNDVFFIRSGLVKLSRPEASGTEAIVGLRSSGTFLGAAELITGSAYQVTATVVIDCRLIRFSSSDFHTSLDTNSETRNTLSLSQSLEICEQWRDLSALKALSGEQRFLMLLQQVAAAEKTTAVGPQLRVALPITTSDTAHLLGVTRAHLSRILGRLERSGVLRRDRGWIVIPDREAFRALMQTAGCL